MSSDLAAGITAIATAVLAAFAFITAIFAGLAFRKQSREVRDQAKMLRIESEQFAEQRKLNAEQAKVLELQATELRESLEERKHAQAARVFIGAKWHPEDPEFSDPGFFTPKVVNGSDFRPTTLRSGIPAILTTHTHPARFCLGRKPIRKSLVTGSTPSRMSSGASSLRSATWQAFAGSGCLTAPSTSRPATRHERASWPPWGRRYPSR